MLNTTLRSSLAATLVFASMNAHALEPAQGPINQPFDACSFAGFWVADNFSQAVITVDSGAIRVDYQGFFSGPLQEKFRVTASGAMTRVSVSEVSAPGRYGDLDATIWLSLIKSGQRLRLRSETAWGTTTGVLYKVQSAACGS